MLLDTFLGGFMVGVVLMVTLGRPVDEEISEGSGGEAFIFVEFFWNREQISLSPVIKHNGDSLNSFGLASPWDISNFIGPWLPHDVTTGLLALNTNSLDKIAMDGFDPTNSIQIKDRKNGDSYGYVWLSKPCIGEWTIGVRVIERNATLKENDPVTIKFRTRMSGAGLKLDLGNIEPKKVLFNEVKLKEVKLGNVFSQLSLKGVTQVLETLKLEDTGGKPFPLCK